MKIVGVYLAAGNSTRMGTHKLALPIGTMSLGSLALETALKSPLDEVYVIIKDTDDMEWIPSHMKAHAKCTIIQYPTSNEGQSESLRYGIQHAQEHLADGVLVMLADQPFITVQMLSEMITCMSEKPACKFVATTSNEAIMPPVLFSSSMYPELLKLRGDKGARAILKGDFLQQGELLNCNDKRLVFDVDTNKDYETLKAFE